MLSDNLSPHAGHNNDAFFTYCLLSESVAFCCVLVEEPCQIHRPPWGPTLSALRVGALQLGEKTEAHGMCKITHAFSYKKVGGWKSRFRRYPLLASRGVVPPTCTICDGRFLAREFAEPEESSP
eukprot:scaffold60_cov325-Pavlova_lutheri.AAC.13